MLPALAGNAYNHLTGQHQLLLRRSISIYHCPKGLLFLGYKFKTGILKTVRWPSSELSTSGIWMYRYGQSLRTCSVSSQVQTFLLLSARFLGRHQHSLLPLNLLAASSICVPSPLLKGCRDTDTQKPSQEQVSLG